MKRGHLEMNVKISEEIASYLERQPENLRGIAVRLVETILNSHPGMTAAIKWGHPSFWPAQRLPSLDLLRSGAEGAGGAHLPFRQAAV